MISGILLIIFSLIGFIISFYLFYKKIKNRKVMCPVRMSCDDVIRSNYGRFLGMSVPAIGFIYYAVIFVVSSIMFVFPDFLSPATHILVFFLASFAFLFSIYLSFVQTFSLHKWCIWCISSAFISFVIFVMSFIHSFGLVIDFSISIKSILVLVHVVGVTLGFGGALITDLFFSRFVGDKKITVNEARTLSIFSEIIWFALGILVLTGFLLYIPQREVLNASPRFITKVIGVCVIIVNGTLLNLFIAPKLTQISFSNAIKVLSKKEIFLRKISFALGAISITSWSVVFLLGSIKSINFSMHVFMFGYFMLMAIAVLASQLLDFIISHKEEDNAIHG